MGDGPPSPVASSLKPAVPAKAGPLGSPTIDSAPQDSLEALAVTGCPSTSSQSPRPSGDETTGGKGYKTEARTAATIGQEKVSVASEVQTVNDGMIAELPTNPMSTEQLTAEVGYIYNKVKLLEATCIQKNKALQPQTHHLLDVTGFLEKIPPDNLRVLQKGQKLPHDTVHESFNRLPKEAEKFDKTPSTPEPIGNFATTPHDFPIKKTTPQWPSPESCLHAFLLAQESRAKAENWPEHEDLVRHITTELREKSRQEAIDGGYLLNIGGKLVDELLRNFEEAKQEEGLLPQAEDTEKTSPKAERLPLVDNRPLDNQELYKKVGNDYYLRSGNTWVPSYNGDQYEALVELHCRLLGEHYDFLLASTHPLASPTLRGLAKRYDLPARMWRHGIHSFLEALRHRLPESREAMETLLLQAYIMVSLFEETMPYFHYTWIECKGDLARYRYSIEETDMKVQRHWKRVSQEAYNRVLQDDPTVGRLYHHLGVLARPQPTFQSGARFDSHVFQLFYLTKSLVVAKPYFLTLESLFSAIEPIVTKNQKSGGKATNVPQTDQDHFLTAVANLTLASLEPKALRAHGYKTGKGQYLQTVYSALKEIGRLRYAKQVKAFRVRPSAQLGLLLCQLLLGIPHAAGRWSPMMVKWAPGFVTRAYPGDLDTCMDNDRDIHEATIAMINTMVPYLLKDADTRDLNMWGFIYVILVFMRSLKTRPELRELVGEAFHAELLVPFLNMLLQHSQDRGRHAFECATQSHLTMLPSGRTKSYTNPLPEHELLQGHFFAREADPDHDESLLGFTVDWAVVDWPPNPKITPSAAQGVAVGHAQEELWTASGTDGEMKQGQQTRSINKHARRRGKETEVGVFEKTRQEDEQVATKDEEARLRDPPLFPAGWFKDRIYDFEERQIRQYNVQDAETCDDRSNQILCLAAQLIGVFFRLQKNETGYHWINMSDAHPVPQATLSKSMPEIVERNKKLRVVYVNPSFGIAEMKKERKRRMMEENRKKDTKTLEAKKKAKINAKKPPADNESQIGIFDPEEILDPEEVFDPEEVLDPEEVPLENGVHGLIAGDKLELMVAAGSLKATMTIGKQSSENVLPGTHNAKQAEGQALSPPVVQGAPASHGTEGSDVVKSRIDEDDDSWIHIRRDSCDHAKVIEKIDRITVPGHTRSAATWLWPEEDESGDDWTLISEGKHAGGNCL